MLCVVFFSADPPHAHVCRRGGEGLAEELADLVGVRSDLRQVIDEQQYGRQRIHTGEKTQIPKLHQELDVFCKQALWRHKKLRHTLPH